MAKKLYFSRPEGVYGTTFEHVIMQLILAHPAFRQYELLDPNSDEHRKRAQAILDDESENFMPYFIELAGNCEAGIFLPFPDGMWGPGMFDEANRLLSRQKLVWTISTKGEAREITALDRRFRLSNEDAHARNLLKENAFDTNK